MAASLMTFVGLPNADSKSNPTQPVPRLTGSWNTLPASTGAGTPTETTVYGQSSVSSRTPVTMSAAESFFGVVNRRRSGSPLRSAFTCEPPTSTVSTAGAAGSDGA